MADPKPLTPRQFGAALFSMGLILVLTTVLLQTFAFFRVYGVSMEPNLQDGQAIIIRREAEVRRGQLIIFSMPEAWESYNKDEAGRALVKRVWAGPGDVFEWDGRSFLVDGVAVGTLPPYPCPLQRFRVKLGPRQVFVAGDNAEISLDSRRLLCNGQSPYVDLATVRAHGDIVWQP